MQSVLDNKEIVENGQAINYRKGGGLIGSRSQALRPLYCRYDLGRGSASMPYSLGHRLKKHNNVGGDDYDSNEFN